MLRSKYWPSLRTFHDPLKFSVRVNVPGPGNDVRTPISPLSRFFRFPAVSVKINLPVAPETFQIIPALVAEVRVNPPNPSIERITSSFAGFLQKYI